MKQLAIFGKKNKRNRGLGFSEQENKDLNYTILVYLEVINQFIKTVISDKDEVEIYKLLEVLKREKEVEIASYLPFDKKQKLQEEKRKKVKQAIENIESFFFNKNFGIEKFEPRKSTLFQQIKTFYAKKGLDILPIEIEMSKEKVKIVYGTFSSSIYYYAVPEILTRYKTLHGVKKEFAPQSKQGKDLSCLDDKQLAMLVKFTKPYHTHRTDLEYLFANDSHGVMGTNGNVLLHLPCQVQNGVYNLDGTKRKENDVRLLDYVSVIPYSFKYHYVFDIEKVTKFIKIPSKGFPDDEWKKNIDQQSIFNFGNKDFIAFNNRFLLLALQTVKSLSKTGFAHIYINEESKAVIITPQEIKDKKETFILIMPVMTINSSGERINIDDVQTYDLTDSEWNERAERRKLLNAKESPKPKPSGQASADVIDRDKEKRAIKEIYNQQPAKTKFLAENKPKSRKKLAFSPKKKTAKVRKPKAINQEQGTIKDDILALQTLLSYVSAAEKKQIQNDIKALQLLESRGLGKVSNKGLKKNTIYQQDCLEGIKKIPDKSVNLIIADPPYFLGMTHNGQKGSFVDLAICKPFYQQLFQECKRVLTEDGVMLFFCDHRSYAFYYPLFDSFIGLSNTIVWNKGGGAGNKLSYDKEFILLNVGTKFNKGGTTIWNDVKGFSAGAKKTNGEKVHPTQKTTEIIAKIVTEFSKAGDTILDPFMGSGTTAIVAHQLKRKFIGFELDEKNFKICCDRLDNYKEEYSLK